MQYAIPEGLIVWVIIIVISVVYRSIKASGGNAAMPPRQRGPQNPRQGQHPRPQMPRPIPIMPYQTGGVPPQTVGAGELPPVSQQEIEQVHQELQRELERAFGQVQNVPTAMQPQPIAQQQVPQQQTVAHRQKRQVRSSGSRDAAVRTGGAVMQRPHTQGFSVEKLAQNRTRLREAYLLTELVGRPRAYDI